MNTPDKIQYLVRSGTKIPAPASIHIDEKVDLNRISTGITIHPGCRITGKDTSIGPGCVLGEEGPVTIDNCQLGANVTLKGGSFSGTAMMEGVSFGPCAHVREASLLEEYSSCAHSVGLKQTVLMPYATLGSLINFCDCLLAGGTDRKNHSEVGSSYIHFNYTPQQDKATASLFGDVPRGVMLDQRPIFLGGQGGLVGPCRIEYGTVIAAGTICRRDVLRQGRLVFGNRPHSAGEVDYEPSIHGDISRILANNFIYIGNLHALYHWYRHARVLFLKNRFDKACHEGALKALSSMVTERINRLAGLGDKLEQSLAIVRRKHGSKLQAQPFRLHREFIRQWPKLVRKLALDSSLNLAGNSRSEFIKKMTAKAKPSYIETVKALSPVTRKAGTAWLQSVADSIAWLRIS